MLMGQLKPPAQPRDMLKPASMPHCLHVPALPAGVVPDKVVVPLQGQAGEVAGGGGKEGEKASQEDDAKPGQPTPCILHMDSIKGEEASMRLVLLAG